MAAQVVDQIRPEVAAGLDGKDEVLGERCTGVVRQLGQPGGKPFPELVVELSGR